MIVPSAANVRLKFPEFRDESDASIEFALEEAQRNVDDSWIAGDQVLGLYYYAAHVLMVEISRRESASGQMVRSETIGRMSITYASPTQPTATEGSDLTTTPYGTRYLDLVTKSNPAVIVI